MLLKDRNLKIAILVSASWHFAFIIFITPVILSGNIKKNSTAISFIGSILERVAAVPERPLSLDKNYFIRHIESTAAAGLNKVTLTQPKIISDPIDTQQDKGEFVSYEYKKNSSVFALHTEKKYKHIVEFSDVVVGGDAKNRIVLFNPYLPRVVALDSNFGLDYRVIVGFKISRHGFVERPECIMSSGSPEVDQLALRYIRKLQFMPGTGESDGLMEGFAAVNLTGR